MFFGGPTLTGSIRDLCPSSMPAGDEGHGGADDPSSVAATNGTNAAAAGSSTDGANSMTAGMQATVVPGLWQPEATVVRGLQQMAQALWRPQREPMLQSPGLRQMTV